MRWCYIGSVYDSARWERHIPSIILGALISLVAIAPLGKEATHPFVLAGYRGLLVAIIALAGWANLRETQDRRICPRFLGLLLALLMLMAFSAWFQAASRAEGIYAFYKNALFGAAFIALAAFANRRSATWRRNVLLGTCAITILHVVGALLWSGGARPVLGSFVNPNYFASFMLPGLAVAVAYAIYGTGRLRYAALAAVVFLAYGIIETVSRGATLAALAMLGIAGLRLALRASWRWKLALMVVLAIASLTAVSGVTYLAAQQNRPAVIEKFFDRGERDPYNYARPLIWLSSVRMIAERPFLGVGLGSYVHTARRFVPAVDGALARYRKLPNIAHNEYLQYAAETGLPAALLLMALAGYLVVTAWKRANNTDDESKPIQEAAILAALGVGGHALVDNNWTVPVLVATLAVVSQADLLPYRPRAAGKPRFEWTPTRTALAAMATIAIVVQSVLIPAVSFYFNEAGHVAFMAQDFQRAESLHSIAVGIMPDQPVLLDNLGQVYLEEFAKSRKPEYLEQATSQFNAAMAANPLYDDPVGHLETALIQSLTGNIEADRPIHEAVVETDRHRIVGNPYNPFIRRNLAEALYNLGRLDEAERELTEAIVMEPNFVPGHLRLAQWYAERGKMAESKERTESAVMIVNRYRNATVDSYDALFLGRPEPANP